MKKFQTRTWDKNSLEYLPECPVCKSTKFKKIFENLEDKVFFCAPGKWNLYKCEKCISIYLNPRPNIQSIVKAYRNYFTHKVNENFSSLSTIAKIKTLMANGYRNWKYKTNDQPSSFFGIIVASVWRNGKRIIDTSMRHLPKPKRGSRLLDVGCGSSDFLLRAKSMGWDVTGLDFDIKAVKAAQKKGIDVRLGGIEILDNNKEKFDFITLAHVIEHVHDPYKTIKTCFELLNRKGKIWIDTPNIESLGLQIYGRSWLGLDCPRHLVMFSNNSLYLLLKKAGFKNIKNQPYRPVCENTFRQSSAISDSIDPFSNEIKKYNIKNKVKNAEKMAFNNIQKREFITLTAERC